MSPRSRTFSNFRTRGTRTRFGSTVGAGQTVEQLRSTCTDLTGPGDCDPFTVQRWSWDGGVINNNNGGFFAAHFVDYIADALVNDANFPHLDTSSYGTSDIDVATQAAARTSPSAAYVDVAANVLELADIALLLRDGGFKIINNVARNNLKLQFGVLPFIRDLNKLTKFALQVDRRVKVLEKLRTTGSYRKTVTIGHAEILAHDTLICQSSDAFINVNRDISTELVVKAHCRWIPAEDLSYLAVPKVMRDIATKIIVNTDINFSALWEAMPWSWMIDWMGNIGTFLKAKRNYVQATLTDVVVMRHTTTIHSIPNYHDPSNNDLKMSSIRFVRDTKTRARSFVAPIAHWPFLSANDMGIVASLLLRH